MYFTIISKAEKIFKRTNSLKKKNDTALKNRELEKGEKTGANIESYFLICTASSLQSVDLKLHSEFLTNFVATLLQTSLWAPFFQ